MTCRTQPCKTQSSPTWDELGATHYNSSETAVFSRNTSGSVWPTTELAICQPLSPMIKASRKRNTTTKARWHPTNDFDFDFDLGLNGFCLQAHFWIGMYWRHMFSKPQSTEEIAINFLVQLRHRMTPYKTSLFLGSKFTKDLVRLLRASAPNQRLIWLGRASWQVDTRTLGRSN